MNRVRRPQRNRVARTTEDPRSPVAVPLVGRFPAIPPIRQRDPHSPIESSPVAHTALARASRSGGRDQCVRRIGVSQGTRRRTTHPGQCFDLCRSLRASNRTGSASDRSWVLRPSGLGPALALGVLLDAPSGSIGYGRMDCLHGRRLPDGRATSARIAGLPDRTLRYPFFLFFFEKTLARRRRST